MERTLLLSVPEDVYESLLRKAEETGQPTEDLAIQWLTAGSRSAKPQGEHDPLDDIIGSIDTDVLDWGANHDLYIGQAIVDSMKGDSRTDDTSDA